MRALSVRQPWAWAIIDGGKDVENRSRNVAGGYRGPVAIHAGLREETGQWPTVLLRAVMQADMLPGHRRRDAARGAFVGVVDLISVHHASDHGGGCPCSPWGMSDHWHLMLSNPRPLPQPIPCRGALGLWTPPADVLEALQEHQ